MSRRKISADHTGSGSPRSNSADPPRRSAGALRRRRVPLEWRGEGPFRILSIDGGGIRGVFPACFLAGLEERYLGGASVAKYFDLIAGTSTGGIIALGLGAGLRASALRDLYLNRGSEIFPPGNAFIRTGWRLAQCVRYRYDRAALRTALSEMLGEMTVAQSHRRLVVPAIEGRHGDLYVFKTPHHPDFVLDGRERMVKVGLATSAAPIYFRPLDDGGYTFLDGGVWANNPTMVGLVDALSCFDIARTEVRILSIGCGARSFRVNKWQKRLGGLWHWRRIFDTVAHFQSRCALAQARLLIGADAVSRIDYGHDVAEIALDDYFHASRYLPIEARRALDSDGDAVASIFLTKEAEKPRPPTAGREDLN